MSLKHRLESPSSLAAGSDVQIHALEVIGIKFIDGYPVVARVADGSNGYPGGSYDIPDVLQLEFSPIDYRIVSNGG